MGQIRKTHIIPRAPIARILLSAGARRVSNDAVEELARVIQSIAEELSRQAVDVAKHAGRKTVTDEDIKVLLERFKRF